MWGLFSALLLLLRLELPLGASPQEQCRQNTIAGVEGKDIALHPNVSGWPTEITWKKDGNIVPLSIDNFAAKNNLELIVNNGSLILHNLSLNDVGCYKAEIEVKDELTETFVGLKVLVPPSLTCSTNDSIQISCKLPTNVLDLSPSYEWKGFEKEEIIYSNQSFVQLHKNIDPSKKITCIITAFNVNVSNSINLNECIQKEPDHQIGGRSRLLILLAVIFVALVVIGCYIYLIKATAQKEGGNCPNAKYDPVPSPEGGNITVNQPDANLGSAKNLEGSRGESSPPES